MRRLVLIVVALTLSVPLAPSSATAGRRTLKVDTGGYHSLFYRATKPVGDLFPSWSETVVLDEEEAILRRIRFELPRQLAGQRILVAIVDAAMGDECESEDGEVEQLAQEVGYEHLGLPVACFLTPREGVEAAELTVVRPRLARLDNRFAMLLQVQPLAGSVAELVLAVEYGPEQAPSVEPHAWKVELSRQQLADRRTRVFVVLDSVARLPLASGTGTLSGRVPALAVTSGEPWDDLVLDHRAFFEAAARAKGPVLGAAGRVLGQPDTLSAAREAARIALDEVELDASGGRGGGWQLPQRAHHTLEDGRGTAADRAALLVALLRAAEIRAEIVLVSRSLHRVVPDSPLALLNQTLVLLPELELSEGSGPLFIDPSEGSAWFGALDEPLIGRDALMLGPRGARWLRLPSEPPRQSWTLNVRELADDRFAVEISGVLAGAAAARLRSWDAGGRVAEAAPEDDLAWLATRWDVLRPVLEELPGQRLGVTATGELGRDQLLPDGHLIAPRLPRAARPGGTRAWPYARDAARFDVHLLESWTFRSATSGSRAPEGQRVTPFWEVDSLGTWSGPLFNRRTRLRFTGELLSPSAAVEVERFEAFLSGVLEGVAAP